MCQTRKERSMGEVIKESEIFGGKDNNVVDRQVPNTALEMTSMATLRHASGDL